MCVTETLVITHIYCSTTDKLNHIHIFLFSLSLLAGLLYKVKKKDLESICPLPSSPPHINTTKKWWCFNNKQHSPCCQPVTYCSMASAFISVCSQPLQGPLHFKLHILSSKGVPCHRQVAHGFRGHLHHHRVAGGEQVAQVVGKAADPGGIASLDANQTHWNKLLSNSNILFQTYTVL